MTTTKRYTPLLSLATAIFAFAGAYYISGTVGNIALVATENNGIKLFIYLRELEMVALVIGGMFIFFRRYLAAMLLLLGSFVIGEGIGVITYAARLTSDNWSADDRIYFSVFPVQEIGAFLYTATAAVLALICFVLSKKNKEKVLELPINADAKTPAVAVVGFVLSFFLGIVGVILAIVAKQKIENSNGELKGLALAHASIFISVFTTTPVLLSFIGATVMTINGM